MGDWIWYTYALPSAEEIKNKKIIRYNTTSKKTVVVCETMARVLDLTITLGCKFYKKPGFVFESDEYILMYGIRICAYRDKAERYKDVYDYTFRDEFEREDENIIVWFSGTDSGFMDDVLRFRKALGLTFPLEYEYHCNRNGHRYVLNPDLYKRLSD